MPTGRHLEVELAPMGMTVPNRPPPDPPRRCCRDLLSEMKHLRMVYYVIVLGMALYICASVFQIQEIEMAFTANDRAGLVYPSLVTGLLIIANAVVELWQRRETYRDLGFIWGVFVTFVGSVVTRFAGLLLEQKIDRQEVIAQQVSVLTNEELAVDEYLSYQVALFKKCCLPLLGIIPVCENVLAHQPLLCAPELDQALLGEAYDPCIFVSEYRLCDDATSMQEFNRNMFELSEAELRPILENWVILGTTMIALTVLLLLCRY